MCDEAKGLRGTEGVSAVFMPSDDALEAAKLANAWQAAASNSFRSVLPSLPPFLSVYECMYMCVCECV